MSDKIKTMTDNVSAIPLSEFDPRGCHGDVGCGCAGAAGVDDSALNHSHLDDSVDAPIVTCGKVRDRIKALVQDIEALKLTEGATHALQSATKSAHQAFAYLEAHAAEVTNGIVTSLR
ncbi:hypothetical protein ACVWZK_003087 [Bradyrhizobium sp. GM0.4]